MMQHISQIIPAALKQWGIDHKRLAELASEAEQWEREHPVFKTQATVTTQGAAATEKVSCRLLTRAKMEKRWPSVDTSNLSYPRKGSNHLTVYTDRGEKFWSMGQAADLTEGSSGNISRAVKTGCMEAGRLWSLKPLQCNALTREAR